MNEHTETVLDYPCIKRDLQDHTVTPMGRALAAQLHPITEVKELVYQHRETSEMVALLAADDAPPLASVVDLHPYLSVTSMDGFYLETPQLLDVALSLDAIQRLRRYAQEPQHRAVLLGRRLSRLADFGILLRQIRSAIDDQGHVRDEASLALQQVRQTLRRLQLQSPPPMTTDPSFPLFDGQQRPVATERAILRRALLRSSRAA